MMKKTGLLAVLILAVSMFPGCSENNPVVVIKTELGDIEVELYADRAPVTVNNFLKYVDSALFENTSFYRVVRMDNQPNDSVRIEVIQGGLREREEMEFAPIRHETTAETAILHRDGVISMARSTPGSATSEFFICVGDQPSLDFGGMRNRDGQGFAAFGKVISGSETVRKIHGIRAPLQYLSESVTIISIVRKQHSGI